MVTKKSKSRNRLISWILAGIVAYILLVNNSLEFLQNFGINVESNVIGVIMIFITIGWVMWKAAEGDL